MLESVNGLRRLVHSHSVCLLLLYLTTNSTNQTNVRVFGSDSCYSLYSWSKSCGSVAKGVDFSIATGRPDSRKRLVVRTLRSRSAYLKVSMVLTACGSPRALAFISDG